MLRDLWDGFCETVFPILFWGVVIIWIFSGFSSDTPPSSTSSGTANFAPRVEMDYRDYSGEEYDTDYDESLTFRGYKCTEDCSGHEAGYEWAEEHGISDPSDCGGNSQSFIEGCESYAVEQMNEEYQEQEEEDYYDRY